MPTPDSKVGDLPQHVDHACWYHLTRGPHVSRGTSPVESLHVPHARTLRRLATTASATNLPDAIAIAVAVADTDTADVRTFVIVPFGNEGGERRVFTTPLPIPPLGGIEVSPSQGRETGMDEIMPAGAHGDEGNEQAWNLNSVSTLPPSSVLPTSRSYWQSGEIGNNATVPQILMTSPEMDVHPKPPAGPTVQLLNTTDRTDFNSGQGGTRGAHGQPSVTSAAKGRHKASVEDDPDSHGNAFTISARTTASVPSSRPTPTSEQPTPGYARLSASLRPAIADRATVRTSPPSRAKDSPSHRAIEPVPLPPAASALPHHTHHCLPRPLSNRSLRSRRSNPLSVPSPILFPLVPRSALQISFRLSGR